MRGIQALSRCRTFRIEPAPPGGLAGELEARLDVQAFHEVVDPALVGPVADAELAGDGFVGQTRGQRRENEPLLSARVVEQARVGGG